MTDTQLHYCYASHLNSYDATLMYCTLKANHEGLHIDKNGNKWASSK